VIAWSGPPDLGDRLAGMEFEPLRLQLSDRGEPVGAAPHPPRVVLLAARKGDVEALLDRIHAVRRRWPLVDVVVVESEASPVLVRDWLRAGARDVLLDADDLLRCIEEILDAQRVLPMVEKLSERRVRSSRFEGMLSRNHAMWDVFEMCARVATTDANVLICGETGTGKELLARALHRQSRRRGRFVAVNCSSLPESLIESELFGHEKGAFTGAARARKGMFRHADGGTLLLDEIGDMPPAAQQSLLRVIEARAVRPVGGAQEVPVDVRIVAATHVALEEAVADGEFREDLFYRLDVIRLEIPPLRERPEDVVYLFGHFVKSLAKHYGVDRPKVMDEFLARMAAYPWPGNVRELENFSERVVLERKRTSFAARDFSRLVRPTDDVESQSLETTTDFPAATGSEGAIDLSRSLEATLTPIVERVERRYLEALLGSTGGRVQEAARRAGISRRTLQRKLRAYGIDKARFRGR